MNWRALPILAASLAALSAQDLTIVNARIIGPNATVIERGSIVVRGGKIASVAAGGFGWADDRRSRHERDGGVY
jgi:imidazolonepropionase-like amidohydrolase